MSIPAPVIVGYVLTRDSEAVVERAISSLGRVASSIVVIDSGSSDGTRERAAGCGATVLVRPFDTFASQRNWALEQIERSLPADYVFALDSDEWLDDELVEDIRDRADAGTLLADVYFIRRRVRFDGVVLRRGGMGSTQLARLFRAGFTRYEDRLVNEHILLPEGATTDTLQGVIEHADVESWEEYIGKHNGYSTLEAVERCRSASGGHDRVRLSQALRRPDLRRRWLRERLWHRVPARPVVRFLQMYVVAGGWLDGRAGLRRAVFEAYQEMTTDLKAEAIASGRRP